MKTSFNITSSGSRPGWQIKRLWHAAAGTLAAAFLCSALPASAATLVLSSTDPVPGANDVYNFAGADNDTLNVSGGADQQNYIAADRPTQGQLFTTPAGASGFMISDIWIRHCGYPTPPQGMALGGTLEPVPSIPFA